MADPTPKPRWYHLTPDRLVLIVLVIEGLLWLSERFQLFSMGSAVLTAVATIGALVLLMLVWLIVALLFRWRFQYSVRSLLILVFVVAVLCSWLSVEMKKTKDQKETVKAVERTGGYVIYDYHYGSLATPPFFIDTVGKQPAGPVWLNRLLGKDFFNKATVVFAGSGFTDSDMQRLKNLPWMQKLELSDSEVTDDGLRQLEQLTQLKILGLGHRTTDAGLSHLRGLSQLQWLHLGKAPITDRGLESLAGLTMLDHLFLDNTQITGAGLEHLIRLDHLQQLSLFGTKVADKDIAKFKKAVPTCVAPCR